MSLFYRIFWGRPYKFDCSIIKDDIIITDAGRRIKVISSPGHTKCHKCYLLEDGNILITGDAIPYPVRKSHCLYGENYITTIENLKSFKKYIDNSAVFLTAHQGILPDPRTGIQKRIDNMEEVVKVVLKAWSDNPADMAKIIESVFGRPGILDRMIAPRMSHENTVRSIVSDCDNP
jgi:glyoxylase-like metal-dependent hydrolase (beta-lactamase superfamily II)